MSPRSDPAPELQGCTIIDYARLRSFTGDDLEVERDILTLYCATTQQLLQRLGNSLDQPEGWARECHSLKGASMNLGALMLGSLAAEAEKLAPAQDWLNRLKAAFSDFRRAVALEDN